MNSFCNIMISLQRFRKKKKQNYRLIQKEIDLDFSLFLISLYIGKLMIFLNLLIILI